VIGVPTASPVVSVSATVTVREEVFIVIPVIVVTGLDESYINGLAPTVVRFSHFEICVPYSKSVSINDCGCETLNFWTGSKSTSSGVIGVKPGGI
jgi:hypothetical protein